MGTYVTDANEIDLLSGMDLATDATSSGTAYEVDWPLLTLWYLDTGTVAGTNNVDIQGSETSDFSDDVVTYTSIPVVNADDDQEHEGTIFITSKYVRASLTIGTGGDMSASVLKLRPAHWMRTRKNSAKILV
jgi:hypothetical protein